MRTAGAVAAAPTLVPKAPCEWVITVRRIHAPRAPGVSPCHPFPNKTADDVLPVNSGPRRIPGACLPARRVATMSGLFRRAAKASALAIATMLIVAAPAHAAHTEYSIELPGATSAEGIASGAGSIFYAGDLFSGDIFRGD